MRISAAFVSLLLVLACGSPVFAQEVEKPEGVVEKMSVKFVRGVVNVVTAVVELPKQTYLTIRDEGGVGYVIGPLKGIGMSMLRCVGGGVEAVLFPIPQPGYYDPILNPDYVWNGWEDKRMATVEGPAEPEQETAPQPKGE